MNIPELAAILHDLGLNVFPVIIIDDKKKPYIPTRTEPYKWGVIKQTRLTREELLKAIAITLREGKTVYLGVLPGLIKEGTYKDYYFFGIDFDKPENIKILNITPERTKEKGIWFERSLSKGHHLYGITADNMRWDKQSELGIELFSDDAYFITMYNKFEGELCQLIPGNLKKVYNDWKQELSKATGIKIKTTRKIDIERIRLGVNEKQRNQSAFDYARILRDKGNTQEETSTIILEWNKKNNPPTDEAELIETVKSVYSKRPQVIIEDSLINEIKKRTYEFFEDNKFKACALAAMITYKNSNADTLKGENRGYLVINDEGKDILRYNNGVYDFNAENYIRGVVHDVLGKKYSGFRACEVINCMKDDPDLKIDRTELEVDNRYICMNNGVYDIETNTLLPHSKDFYFTNKLNIDYEPDAKCPGIEKFFSEIVKDKNTELLAELFGWCLQRHYRYQYIVFFNGKGANGKGTLIRLMHMFLGRNNTISQTLKELITDPFSKAHLYQKNANLGDDIGQDEITETSTLKRLTGDGWISAQHKHKHRFEFITYAKLIFACNNLPRYPQDDTFSLWRRIIIIEFPNTFYGDTDKKNILSTLITNTELSGLFNLAVKGMQRLDKNNKFTYDLTVDQTRKIYTDLAEPAKKFIGDNYEHAMHPEEYMLKQEIWQEYNEWCGKEKLPVLTVMAFWQMFYEAIPGAVKGNIAFSINPERPGIVRYVRRKAKEKTTGTQETYPIPINLCVTPQKIIQKGYVCDEPYVLAERINDIKAYVQRVSSTMGHVSRTALDDNFSKTDIEHLITDGKLERVPSKDGFENYKWYTTEGQEGAVSCD